MVPNCIAFEDKTALGIRKDGKHTARVVYMQSDIERRKTKTMSRETAQFECSYAIHMYVIYNDKKASVLHGEEVKEIVWQQQPSYEPIQRQSRTVYICA